MIGAASNARMLLRAVVYDAVERTTALHAAQRE
jgi:hypothetical protein